MAENKVINVNKEKQIIKDKEYVLRTHRSMACSPKIIFVLNMCFKLEKAEIYHTKTADLTTVFEEVKQKIVNAKVVQKLEFYS